MASFTDTSPNICNDPNSSYLTVYSSLMKLNSEDAPVIMYLGKYAFSVVKGTSVLDTTLFQSAASTYVSRLLSYAPSMQCLDWYVKAV